PETDLRLLDYHLVDRIVNLLTTELDQSVVTIGSGLAAAGGSSVLRQVVDVAQADEVVIDVADMTEVNLAVCQEDCLILLIIDEFILVIAFADCYRNDRCHY